MVRKRSVHLSPPECMNADKPFQWFQTNPHRFHLLTLGTLHSLPVPVPRRSQKMFKPDFFEQLKRGREASDAAWDVSDWFSKVCVRTGTYSCEMIDVQVRRRRKCAEDGIRMILCAKLEQY